MQLETKQRQKLIQDQSPSANIPAALAFGGAFLFTPASESEEEADLLALAIAFDLLFFAVPHAPTGAPGSSSQ